MIFLIHGSHIMERELLRPIGIACFKLLSKDLDYQF